MKRQIEIIDVDDMTLLMHASCSGSAAMFNVVTKKIQRNQVYRCEVARKIQTPMMRDTCSTKDCHIYLKTATTANTRETAAFILTGI